MKVIIQLVDDMGTVLDEYQGDLFTPYTFNTHYERPIRQGVRALYHYTYQPGVKIDLKQKQEYDNSKPSNM